MNTLPNRKFICKFHCLQLFNDSRCKYLNKPSIQMEFSKQWANGHSKPYNEAILSPSNIFWKEKKMKTNVARGKIQPPPSLLIQVFSTQSLKYACPVIYFIHCCKELWGR